MLPPTPEASQRLPALAGPSRRPSVGKLLDDRGAAGECKFGPTNDADAGGFIDPPTPCRERPTALDLPIHDSTIGWTAAPLRRYHLAGLRRSQMLRSEDIRRFEERLKAERDAIELRIAANKRGIQETVQDESGVGNLEDEASLLYDREAEIDENARDRKELAQVNRALERIEQGTYGLSEVSGKPIPIDRLEALPYAITLVDERPLEPE
jgi:DnaK suppressor protein